MIQGLTPASTASVAKTYGFDGKFVLEAGFEHTFDAEGSIPYEEKSGFKTVATATEPSEDIMTVFFAKKVGEKLEGLTMGALTRGTLPSSAKVDAQASRYMQGVNINNIKPLFTTKVTASQVATALAGKTIQLQAVQAYKATSAKGVDYNGKTYYWIIK